METKLRTKEEVNADYSRACGALGDRLSKKLLLEKEMGEIQSFILGLNAEMSEIQKAESEPKILVPAGSDVTSI